MTTLLEGILTHVGLILGFLLAGLLVMHLIRQKQSPSGTIAWLLILVLLPYVGVPLYLMLGGRKLNRKAKRKSNLGLGETQARPLDEATLFDRLLRSYGIPGATSGNRVTLCHTGQEAYARLVELIEGAERSLHIAMFVFRLDEVGKDIFQRLVRRAADGVQVRLLLDSVGSMYTTRRRLRALTRAGGRIAYFMPVLHIPFRGRTNLRNHRKIVVADGQRAMAGGANIGNEYIGATPNEARWHDLSFILEGPAVRNYAEVFCLDWEFTTGEKLTIPPVVQTVTDNDSGAMVQVVPSGPDIPGDVLYDTILSIVFEAKKRLWIVTPYFVPDEALAKALRLAAHRGVDVRIFLPAKSNHRLVDLARGPYLRGIQDAGGKILLFPNGMIHAKVTIMDDDLAIIGSANMDIRSLFLNFETAMFIYSTPEIRATEAWVNNLMANLQPGIDKVGNVRDFCESIVRMMAPLL